MSETVLHHESKENRNRIAMDERCLLKRFVSAGDEEAFGELVRRRIDLVYSIGMRVSGGDSHFAEELCQEVFVTLAKKAWQVSGYDSVTGWLVRVTQLRGKELLRAERRRQVRERKAFEMKEQAVGNASDEEWAAARPMLDAAMAELKACDRDALCLRFFEGSSFRDVGVRLGMSENAARMRVNRALEKLGALLEGRGIRSSTTALGVALAGQVGWTAPTGLSAKVVASGMAAGGVGAGLMGGAVFMSTGKIVGSLGVLVGMIGLGIAYHEANERDALEQRLYEREQAWEKQSDEKRELAATLDAVQGELDTLKREGSRVETAGTASGEGGVPEALTEQLVMSRYQRAAAAMGKKDYEAALEDYFWCYTVGMVEFPQFAGLRDSKVLMDLVTIGDELPVAKKLIQSLRDEARQRILEERVESRDIASLVSINRQLGEGADTIALYDAVGEDLKATLANYAMVELVEAQRYEDASRAARFPVMKASYEMMLSGPPNGMGALNTEEVRETRRKAAADGAVLNLELLAGAGRLEEAIELGALIFSRDDREDTREKVARALRRAGDTELIELMESEKPSG